MSFFGHTSACTLVANIGALHPAGCDGSASCACEPGTDTCTSSCTTFFTRITLFGGSAVGELLAAAADPSSAFYLWLYEPFPTNTCTPTLGPPTNLDRWILLNDTGLAGAGMETGGSLNALEFGTGAGGSSKIVSAAHYPQQAATVDAWANWYDAAGPGVAKINVDGGYSDMTLDRGTPSNGAWHASVSGVGSGCHRYLFAFKDGGGADVFYPTLGSLAIGDGSAECPDFSYVEPPIGGGFDRIFEYNFEP